MPGVLPEDYVCQYEYVLFYTFVQLVKPMTLCTYLLRTLCKKTFYSSERDTLTAKWLPDHLRLKQCTELTYKPGESPL